MTNSKPKRAKKSNDVNPFPIARDWLARGVMPIPIRPRLKKPKTQHLPEDISWNKVKVTEENLDEHFAPGDNVGGLWGKPSGWIVDVDLDWDEAAKLAPHILPETFIYGRRSRPGTHYLYRCKGVNTFKRGTHGKDGEIIVEVRSTGTQSVLPPSIHPDGERFEINHDVEFSELSPAKLERLVDRLAALAVFTRCYPEGKGRHDYVHALTGALLWSQWQPDDVANSMGAILMAVGDREDDRGQRERTVINTIEKFEQGDKVNGWPTLSSWVPEEDLKQCKKWCTVKGLKSSVKIKGKGKLDDGPPPDLPPPQSAEAVNPRPPLEVPGLVGKIANWVHRTSYADQPLFDLGAAFTILALATQNRYVIQGTNTPLSPFFMCLGRTGGGKDSARQAVITAADQIRMAEKVFGGFQSFHALLDELSKPPHVMCWLWDEAARKMRAAAKSSGGADSAVITWLLDLYGKGASTVLGLPGRKQSISKISHPFMLVTAFAQPEDMVASITLTDISTGLLNRFILLDAGDEIPPSHYPDYTGFPSAIANPLIDISKIRPPDDKDFIEVGWATNRVFNMLRDFREECRELSSVEVASGEVWGRAWQNALILCGLLAVGVDWKRPRITEEMAEWATAFIRWSCNNWTIRLDATSARSLTERNSKMIERIIREPNAFRKFAQDGDQKALRKGLIPRGMLFRICRHLKAREVDEVLTALAEADVLGTAEIDEIDCYYWKSA